MSNSTIVFIQKAKNIHNNKYNYDKVKYINSKEKVIITCPFHGDFYQIPNSHLNGKGCSKCSGKNKLTTEEFIQKARTIHGDKYDYTGTIYMTAKTPVQINCSIHGPFHQIPNNHTQGSGCPFCISRNIKDTEEFIRRAKVIHSDKYDYNKSIFIDGKSKVIISCKIHGDFEQSASEHIRGRGCPMCNKGINLTLEEFIQKAKQIHGNKYNYSKFIYMNSHTKGIIICSDHGEFLITPNNHINHKQGCSKCSFSKGELVLEEIFKKYNIKAESQYNIPEMVNNYKIDFYLPEYRLLIEFHGKQHYEYIPFFHDGNYTFEDQKNRDNMVRDAAIRWKYGYLEFNYKQLNYMTKEQFEEIVISGINRFKLVYPKTKA